MYRDHRDHRMAANRHGPLRTIVVTGASAGIGRAIVRRFAAPGVRLGLIARDAARLEAAAEEVRALGGQALVLPLDVADADAVEAAAARVEDELGPIDLWINNAMVTVLSRAIDMTPAEFARVTDVTYLGAVHGTLAALRRMAPRGGGTIIQICSALAYRPIPLQSAYCAAKAAMLKFTEGLRSELIHDQIDVDLTVLQLPGVNTPQFDWARNRLGRRQQPVPPIYQPERIAEAVHHAARHPRREYWLGRAAVASILLEKFAPALGDRMVAAQAFEGQLTDQPLPEGRADNLFETVPGAQGARGRFSNQVTAAAPAIWAAEHRDRLVTGAALGLAGLALAGWLRRR